MNTEQHQETRKVILVDPSTTEQALVITNLKAVAIGTLRLLAWTMTFAAVIIFGFLAGMIKAANTGRRRGSWL
ncbi:MAG: hypothetical protein ABI782_10325 [Anaerolineaceae bacterium]